MTSKLKVYNLQLVNDGSELLILQNINNIVDFIC